MDTTATTSTAPIPPPAPGDLRQQVVPGEPHTHTYATPGGQFTVCRPTRGQVREIRARIARSLTILGADARTLNRLDGDDIQAEAYLSVILTAAPAAWWRTLDADEAAFLGRKAGDRVVTVDGLYTPELRAAWEGARGYLRRFEEFRDELARPGDDEPGAGTAGGHGGAKSGVGEGAGT